MFDFDTIIKRVPQVEQYKKRHYYDACRPMDEILLYDTLVHVKDHEGREGDMSLTEFFRSVDYKPTKNKEEMSRLIIACQTDNIRHGKLYNNIKNKFELCFLKIK